MSIETIATGQTAETKNPRQAWSKPDLIDYGTVGDLTQGGGAGGVGETQYVASVGG